jgi:hypothetical protein
MVDSSYEVLPYLGHAWYDISETGAVPIVRCMLGEDPTHQGSSERHSLSNWTLEKPLMLQTSSFKLAQMNMIILPLQLFEDQQNQLGILAFKLLQ